MATVNEITIPYLKQVRDFLGLELANFKTLEGSVLDQVKGAIGFDALLGDVYYNDLNLVFTTPQDYEIFKYAITSAEIIFRLEVPEYHQFLVVVRYHNDVLLQQLLA